MKLGIIGLGRRMADMLKAFRIEAPELEIVGVLDANHEEAKRRLPEGTSEKTPFFDSLPELLEKAGPDALAIGTRCDSHTSFAIQAAEYDLPLFLEKPVATNLSDAVQQKRAFQNSRWDESEM